MQYPTCINIRIRSTHDAHIIFHAVHLGILRAINRRLDPDERAQLRSGCVYAWEERGQHTEVTGLGIERFTEGRRWGPSRVRDEFLFYYEKSPPALAREKENPMIVEMRRKEWDPLVKQTYSVWVDGPRGRRKWHLTAYFTQATVDQLQTIDEFPQLAKLEVPPSTYISTRLGKPRRTDDILSGSDYVHSFFKSASTPTPRTYAPFPLPYEVTPPSANQLSAQRALSSAGYEYPAEARREFADTPRQIEGAVAGVHLQRHQSDASLTLPPLHALTIPGTVPSTAQATSSQRFADFREDASAQSRNRSSEMHYASHAYATPSGALTQPTCYPPTPNSALSVSFNSPVYPPGPHILNGSPCDTTPHSSFQTTYHNSCQTSKYTFSPSTPVNQAYPDSFASSYAHTTVHPSPRQGPSYTFVPHSPAEGQNVVRPSLSPPIDPCLQDSASDPSHFIGMPAAALPELSMPATHRARSNAEDGLEHHRSGSETGDDAEVTARHSPPLSPRSIASPGVGKRLDLAPLRSLTRPRPYNSRPRDKFDDKALMAFSGRRNSFD